MARSSSPAMGCSTDSEFFRRCDPDAGALDIDGPAAHSNGLRDAQAVPVDHQEQRVITDAVAPFLGRLEQPIDLRPVQEVLGPLVGIGGFRPTLYTSPLVAIAAAS